MRLFVPGIALLICASTLFYLPAKSASRATQSQTSESSDATLSPYFWVKSEDPSVEQLPLKSTSVKSSIAGVMADVRVTQVYKNEGRKPIEAIYVFPGSTRAAVYGMKMTIGSRTIQANIRGKEQARQEYEQAKQQGKSASLLEQHRPNVFQMNVANILPGDEIKVELSYTELLVPTDGTYDFVYPTVVGPRYSNTPASQATDSEKWVANPYTRQGEAPLSTFDMEVRLSAGMPIQRMSCATHKSSIDYDSPGEALLKLDSSEAKSGNRDFILKYQLEGGQIQSGLLLSKGKDENFFLLMVQPPKQVKTANIPPREYVFIMDVSGSMSGYPIETSKALMKDLVSHLRPEDRFNLLVFESGSSLWSPNGSQPATPENLQKALGFVGSQSGGGGTEIVSALRRALALPRTKGMSRTFVIATDGYISVEPQVLDVVRDNLGNANMFAFGIGSSVNRFLIEGIAHAGMGEPFIVTKPEEASAQAEKLRNYISSPVLTQIKTAFKGFETYDVEPLQLPDVLSERPVICFGKWKGDPKGAIEVTGISGTGPFRQSFDVSKTRSSEANGALRFLWARHRIQLLGDYGGLGDAERQKKAITDLGLKYGLLTNYTSFVAIDSLVRNAGGQHQSVTQPLPLPEGVSDLAVRRNFAASAGAMCKMQESPRMELEMNRARIEMKKSKTESPHSPSPQPTVPSITAAKPSPVPTVQLHHVKADRPNFPYGDVMTTLTDWLKEPGLAKQLKGLPSGTALELRVDASGKVIFAAFDKPFDRPFTNAPNALKLIRAWRFTGWKETGTTTLRITLIVGN